MLIVIGFSSLPAKSLVFYYKVGAESLLLALAGVVVV